MFTGIVECIGTVEQSKPQGGSWHLAIRSSLVGSKVHLGDSILVNGVCLTLAELVGEEMVFHVSHETVQATTLRFQKKGDRVHLEQALSINGRLGGHLVTGHVDGVGKVLSRLIRGANLDINLQAPPEVEPYLVAKGSVAVDGVSLTVNEPKGDRFRVTLVPTTLQSTVLSELGLGDLVNLEADILGKYVRHFLAKRNPTAIDEQFLVEHGFLAPK